MQEIEAKLLKVIEQSDDAKTVIYLKRMLANLGDQAQKVKENDYISMEINKFNAYVEKELKKASEW